MDHAAFDDEPQPVNRTFNYDDTNRDAMVEAFRATPEDQHQRDEAAMVAAVQRLSGEASHIVDHPDVIKQLSNVDTTKDVREQVEQAHDLAVAAATESTPSLNTQPGLPDNSSNVPPDTSGGTQEKSGVPAPSGIERTLASIQASKGRDQRFVVTGDPDIERRFYDRMLEKGLATQRGQGYILHANRDKCLDVLQEVVGKVQGAKAIHALSMEFDRRGDGVVGNVMAGLKNSIGRQHTVDVVVVGNPEAVNNKLQELGGLLTKMDKSNFLEKKDSTHLNAAPGSSPDSSKGQLKDGMLVLPKDGSPVSFKAKAELYDLVQMTKDTVSAHQRDQQDKSQARKDYKDAKTDGEIAKGKSGSTLASDELAADGSGASTKSAPVNAFAAKLAASMDQAFNSDGGLTEKNARSQPAAEELLNKVRNLKDPAQQELGSLPDDARQKAIVQLAALVVKVDTKDLGDGIEKKQAENIRKGLDKEHPADPSKDKAAEPTTREKVESIIAAEKQRDPQFETKAAELVAGMVTANQLTREQANKVLESVAPGKDLTSAKAGAAAQPNEGSSTDASTSTPRTSDAAGAGAARVSPQEFAEKTVDALITTARANPAMTEAEFLKLDAAGRDSELQRGGDALLQLKTMADEGKSSNPNFEAQTRASIADLVDNGQVSRENGELFTRVMFGSEAKAGAEQSPADSKWVEAKAAAVEATGVEQRSGQDGSPGTANDKDKLEAIAKTVTSVEQAFGDKLDALPGRGAEKLADSADQKAPTQGSLPGIETASVNTSGGDKAAAVEPSSSTPTKVEASSAAEVPSAGTQADLAKSAEPRSALVAKVDTLTEAGPQSLTREDASSLLAALDGRRANRLNFIDGRSGEQPTQTLIRVEGLLKEISKGNLGDDLAASARDLNDVLNKWKDQDIDRVAKVSGTSLEELRGVADKLRAQDGAWHQSSQNDKVAPDGQRGQVPAEAPLATTAREPSGNTRAESSVAPVAQPAEARLGVPAAETARAAALYSETESAAGRLATLMANPAGSFTNRDKSWNESNVEVAVNAVLRVDVASTEQMSPNQRTQLAAYASWIADNANAGRLPGFDSAEGKARADALTQRATALIAGANGKLQPAVTTQLAKADRMVGALQQRQMAPARLSKTSRSAPASPKASNLGTSGPSATTNQMEGARLARDLSFAVFKNQELSEPHAKFILKNAPVFNADALQSLSPKEKAQAAVSLAHLAQEVRDGAMGDFKNLSPVLQKQVNTAVQVATQLQATLAADPSTKNELTKAYLELSAPGASSGSAEGKTSGLSADKPAASKDTPELQQQAAPAKGAGRSMDR